MEIGLNMAIAPNRFDAEKSRVPYPSTTPGQILPQLRPSGGYRTLLVRPGVAVRLSAGSGPRLCPRI